MTIETSDGVFTASFTHKGLAALSFPNTRKEIRDHPEVRPDWQRQTAESVQAVLRGDQPRQLPPLDISRGTDFQQKVWRVLLSIPAGKTCSYGEIAAMIRVPGAARAV